MTGPLPWIGGKNRFCKRIIAAFPQHNTYVEPFAGGAQVFFHKKPSAVEVLNDLDGEIVNFYRVCQWHYKGLVEHLQYSVVSRKLFELLTATKPETLTDIQRAARFFYLQKNAFGGRVVRQNYHYSIAKRPNYTPERIPGILERTNERLKAVQIECLPYEIVIEKYDSPETAFYLDPPYFQRELYRFNFSEHDFVSLAERLAQVQGKFVLSLNDVPEVRKLFARFRIKAFEASYSAQMKPGTRYGELLIMNFD